MACARCYAKKERCDRPYPGAPCFACQQEGVTCVERVKPKRKPYNGGKRRATRGTAGAARKKTKTETKTERAQPKGGGSSTSTAVAGQVAALQAKTSEPFFSTKVDLGIFTVLRGLSKISLSHWGLRSGIKIFMNMALRKMNMGLLNKVSSFSKTIGIDKFSFMNWLTSSQIQREVKIGEFDDVGEYILRKHDEAAGVSSAAGTWDAGDRILLSTINEFAPSGTVFMLSPEAKRLLVTDAMFAKFPTDFFPQDVVVRDRVEERHYNALAHACQHLIPGYTTKHSGPMSSCTPNITLQTLQGPIQVYAYQTYWFGNTGTDGGCVCEFVRTEDVSASASAVVVRASAEEEARAARALVALAD